MMNIFSRNKTKWQPILMYKPVAFNTVKLVYARYNKNTGLYDFKTQTVCSGNYSNDIKLIEYNTEEILANLKYEV